MKKRFHINIFTEKYQWGCRLKYSCRYEGLEFYLKGTQSQVLSCRICKVLQSLSFTEHYFLLGNYFWLPAIFLPGFLPLLSINSVTTSSLGTPEIATCKRSILLALKIFKGNQKKKQADSNILGLRSTQRTKGCLVETVARRCPAKKKCREMFGKIHRKTLEQETF